MKRSDFLYDLPEEYIAQYPSPQRTASKLLILDRKKKHIDHRIFNDIVEYFREGDVLVLNNTKVIPARLFGHKETSGALEVFLLHEETDGSWEVLLRPSRRIKKGARIIFSDDFSCIVCNDAGDRGMRQVRFEVTGNFWEALERVGKMPLPPYIKREADPLDKKAYQTVFAKRRGAVAAPTAGLHFTPPLLQRIEARGVHIAEVTLHVGYGTFRPVAVEELTEHTMHYEYCEITEEIVQLINESRKKGRRIIACGTTAVRTLETAGDKEGILHPYSGKTDIFIYPPYTFKCVDALITNFHLPGSTLLMLTCAFGGHEAVLNAYEEAKKEQYRFYSYGDAMFIV